MELRWSSQATAVEEGECIRLQLILPHFGGEDGLKQLFLALIFRRLN